MPRINRRRKGRFNWERSVQGGISGAATGFSAGGPKGAAIGAGVGFFTGGLTGRDTSVDRLPYEEAIRYYSRDRRRQARVAGDEHASQAGAAFSSRGLNSSELAAGVISANRGRFARAAEDDISRFTSNINLRIAEAERNAQMAEDDMTRQGWLDLAGQLGLMAISGEFTPEPELSESMLESLKRTHPKDVEKWIRGRTSTEALVGIYDRYAQLYGEPGTQQRRFSDLEMDTQGQGRLPDAILPQDVKRGKFDPSTVADNEQMRRETIPTSPDGTQGQPEINMEEKPIAPLPAGEQPGGTVDRVRQVVSAEDFESLMMLYPNLGELISGGAAGAAKGGVGTPEGSARGTQAWAGQKSMPQELDRSPTSERTAPKEQWGSGESDWGFWNRLANKAESILNDPNSTPYAKEQAARQLRFIQNEMHRLETGEDIIDVTPIPPVESPGVSERAEDAHESAQGRIGVAERAAGNRIPRKSGQGRERFRRGEGGKTRVYNEEENVGSFEIEPPQAERKGKPNRLSENPPHNRSMGRFREMEADEIGQDAPPPPPDLQDVPVQTKPLSQKDLNPPHERSMGRFREMESTGRSTPEQAEAASSPLIVEANKMVGKMETKDKAALMKYFGDIRYFDKPVDPTKVPWCAVFLNAALEKSGYEPLATETYSAREFMRYGTEGTGEVGDIAVWENHVGIVVKTGEKIRILGGNQKDGVTITDKDELDKKTGFLGYRSPVRTEQRQGRFAR